MSTTNREIAEKIIIHKCGTKDCQNAAEFYAAWPGQPMKFCEPCLERAKNIASVMGFALPWARIPQPKPAAEQAAKEAGR